MRINKGQITSFFVKLNKWLNYSLVFLTYSCLILPIFQGKVVSIIDGDTIIVLYNESKTIVRLNGIDCPEKSQTFGQEASQFISNLILEKTITIKNTGKDRYERVIGDIFLSDGLYINLELIKAGYAWWYRQYSNSKELTQAELKAKISKKGLWSNPNPIPPWIYRRNYKKNR